MALYVGSAAAAADGCLHYWPFDEESGGSVEDKLQGFNGAIKAGFTGTIADTIVAGTFGNARDLAAGTDGISNTALNPTIFFPIVDPANYGQTAGYQPSAFSFRLRVNFRTFTRKGDILYCSASAADFGLWINSNQTLNIWGDAFSFDDTTIFSTGVWYDLAITYDGTTLRVYVDGALSSSGAVSIPFQPYGGEWGLGNQFDKPNSYIVDELALWNRELTAGEVSSLSGDIVFNSAPAPQTGVLYASTAAALADNCLHYWRMDAEEGEDLIVDSIGSFDGAVVSTFDVNGAEKIVSTPMKEGRRTFFNTGSGSGDRAVLSCDPALASLASSQFWNATFRIRVKLDEIVGSGGMAASIGNRSSDLGSLAIYISNPSAPTCKWSRPTNSITANIVDETEWLEIVATSEGDSSGCTLRMYINGVEIGSSITGANKGGLNPYSQPIAFGGESPSTSYTHRGIVDEAAFWSRTLSASEISDLYNSGASKFLLPTTLSVEQGLEASWNILNTVDYYLLALWDMESTAYVYPPEVSLGKISETVRFKAILEGANDALSDIEIPISSFNARLRSARNSYLSITAPSAANLISDIEARSNGELVVQQVEGDQITELARVNFQDLRIDKGARSGSTLALSGYKQITYENSVSWSIQNHSYFSRSGSKSRIRLQANSRIRPNDQIVVEGLSFVCDTVTLIGSTSRVFMELSE